VRTKVAIATLATLALGLTAACSSPSSGKGGGGKATGGPSSGGASGGQSAAQKAAAELGIDLSKCPTDITKPLTGTVKVGTTLAQTGPIAAALAPVGVGEKAAIADLNATSGLPIKFSLTIKDDQFSPDKTLTAVQELIQSDKVDLLDGVIGTANLIAARGVAEKYCVPIIAGSAGGTSANQVSKYPFTTVTGAPFYLDAEGWFGYLKEKFPNGAKIALLTANTDSGKDYLAAVDDLSKGTNFKIVSRTTLDATAAAAPSSQVTTMRSSGADVLLAQPSPGPQCAALIKEVAQQGWKPQAFFITNSCSPTALVAPAGPAAQNVLCNLYLNDPNSPSAADNPGLQKVLAAIKKVQPSGPIVGSNLSGYGYIEILFKAAQQAAQSPLGLSRLGILYAATHLTYQPAFLQPGVDYSLDYPKDEVSVESEVLSTFDAKAGQWKTIKVLGYEGQLTGKASG